MTPQAQRYITQLKAQVNSLEGEVEEQRKQKQKALVDNEQLRDELEKLQQVKQDSDRSLRLCAEAESRCRAAASPSSTRGLWEATGAGADVFSPPPEKANATEIRYTKLKEKHSELINTHAELLRKVTPLSARTSCCLCPPVTVSPQPNPVSIPSSCTQSPPSTP